VTLTKMKFLVYVDRLLGRVYRVRMHVCTCVYGMCVRVYMVRVHVCIWYVCTCV